MNLYRIVFTAALCLCFASCAGMNKKEAGMAQGGQAATENNRVEDTYIIGPDDMVHIVVEGHPEWTGDYIVGPLGSIIIPNIGNFNVEGVTAGALEKKLAEHLSQYINNPRITASVVKYNSNIVYVLGEVNVPGKYSTEGKSMTLRDAVVKAGLVTRFAATDRVYIISPTNAKASMGKPPQTVVNLYRVLYRGELERNVILKPGDIVYVPKNIFGKVYDLISVFLGPISTIRAPVVP